MWECLGQGVLAGCHAPPVLAQAGNRLSEDGLAWALTCPRRAERVGGTAHGWLALRFGLCCAALGSF